MQVVKKYLTKNDCYNSGKRIKPVGMQLHTIGTAQNSAESLASYWNQGGVSACVHYCVDAETEGKVLQFLPDNFRSWGDGGYGNGNLITVELMESDYMKYTGGSSYTVTNAEKFKTDVKRAYDTAVQFFAAKCKEYGWNPWDKLPNGLYRVSSHDEGRRAGVSSGHVDPTHIWPKIGKTMDDFRDDVKAAMGSTGTNIKNVKIDNTTVEAISKVVYGEAAIIGKKDALVAVAQCVFDMWKDGGYGKTVSEILKNNFAAYGTDVTTDECRQAVYDVFVNGKKRFADAKLLQFRSFTEFSDGKGNVDEEKCADLLKKLDYLGKDYKDNKWGHLYFGIKTGEIYVVQVGAYSSKTNAQNRMKKIKAAGFDAFVKYEDGYYRVQCGAFSGKNNAGTLVQKLQKAGFTAIIKEA